MAFKPEGTDVVRYGLRHELIQFRALVIHDLQLARLGLIKVAEITDMRQGGQRNSRWSHAAKAMVCSTSQRLAVRPPKEVFVLNRDAAPTQVIASPSQTRKPRSWNPIRVIRLPFGLVATALLVSSCSILPSHIHDEKAAALSSQLQSDFAAYREDQASLYANMAANLALFKAEEEALLGRFMANYGRAITSDTPDLNGARLRRRIAQIDNELEVVKERITSEIKTYLSESARAKLEAKDAAGAIRRLTEEIKAAEKEAADRQAEISAIQNAIAKLPDTLEGLKGTAGDLKAVLEDEAGATSGTVPGEVLGQIGLALSSVPSDLKKAAAADIGEEPDLAVRILQLGLDLARLDKRRAETELAGLEAQREILQEAFAETQIASALLERAKADPAVLTLGDDELVIKKIEEIKASSDDLHRKVYGITGMLRPLRYYTTAAWLVAYQDTLMPLRVARLEHQESIAVSQTNDQARQAVIASGLDALAKYHQGGLTAEDIASIISLAQSIAVYIIAF